jgi:hypothetical protein
MPLETSNTSMEVTYFSLKPDIANMYSSFIFIRFSMLIEVLPPALSAMGSTLYNTGLVLFIDPSSRY